jgi:IclR family KDG regulon transcriptional repressor
LKFIEISSLHLHQLELKTEATPYMRRLSEVTGQVSHLAIMDDTDVVYIEKFDLLQSLRLYSQIGKRIPVYCSALGKVLLSSKSNEIRNQILDSIELKPFTKNTIIDRKSLEHELNKTKQRGWAVDNEEHEPGVCCIAAPVFDFTGKAIAAISISGDKSAIDSGQKDHFIKMVVEAAKDISERMGFIRQI